MKNSIAFIPFFVSCVVYGQREITVGDLLPELFYTKQSLIDHYLSEKLNYDTVLQDLESKSTQGFKLISKHPNQIIYTQIDKGSLLDTFTYNLTFNSNKQVIKWENDLTDCYDRQSSDMPEPVISTIYYTYNHIGQLEQITGYCASKDFAIQHDYYYNKEHKLDSIIFQQGYANLYPYQKIIFIDTSVVSGEPKSAMVLILNTTFDYTKWLKVELNDTAYIHAIQSEEPKEPISRRGSVRNYDYGSGPGNNYVYEFDSLGNITSLSVLDANAEYSSLMPSNALDICEENCAWPSLFEFYYEDHKVNGIEMTSFNIPSEEGKSMCRCAMKISYRKEKIKEIKFYAGLDYFGWNMVKIWTKRKGFQDINEQAAKSK